MRKVTLGLLGFLAVSFLLLKPSALRAESKLKLAIEFDNFYYSTTATVDAKVSVDNRSSETRRRNRIIFTIYNRLIEGENLDSKLKSKRVLFRRYWYENLLRGKTAFRFQKDLSKFKLTEGVYPAELVVELSNDKILRKKSFMVLVNKQARPLPVALVWDWHLPPQLTPDGLFIDNHLAKMIGTTKSPGLYRQYASKIDEHSNVKVNLAITPVFLEEIRRMIDGYGVRTDGKTKLFSERAPVSRAAKSFINQLENLARYKDRVEIIPVPYSYPSLPVLASAGWQKDFQKQLEKGEAVTKSVLRLQELSSGRFSPGLDLDPQSARRLLDAGAGYTIVNADSIVPRPKFVTAKAYRLAAKENRSLTGFVADPVFSRIINDPGEELKTKLSALFALRLLGEKKGQGAAVAVIAAKHNNEASAEQLEEIFGFFENTPWLRTETLSNLITVLPVTEGKLKDWRLGLMVDQKYWSGLVEGRRELDNFALAISEKNPVRNILEEKLLVAESSDWLDSGENGDKALGWIYLQNIKDTINKSYANISISPMQTVTFSSNQGKIPIAITNKNSYPVQLTLKFDGGKAFIFSDDKERKVNLMPKDNLVVYQVRAKYRGSGSLKVFLISGTREIASGQITVMVSDVARYFLTAISAISLILIAALILKRRRKET